MNTQHAKKLGAQAFYTTQVLSGVVWQNWGITYLESITPNKDGDYTEVGYTVYSMCPLVPLTAINRVLPTGFFDVKPGAEVRHSAIALCFPKLVLVL